MPKKLPISCFIIAQNEADRIAATINSVKDWVDEIIVIDSGSTDDTVALSERMGARVLFHAWPGYGMQKRFGEDQCRNDWLLNLDADEVVTPELAAEIAAAFAAGPPQVAGFFLQVRDLLPGEKQLAPFAHTNHCLRLYDRRRGRFSESPVHDSVILQEGDTQEFRHPVLHRSFRSLSHMLEKIASYSSAQALELKQRGHMRHPYLRLVIEAPFAFIKMYLLRAYLLRGIRGVVYSGIYAYGRWLRIWKYIRIS